MLSQQKKKKKYHYKNLDNIFLQNNNITFLEYNLGQGVSFPKNFRIQGGEKGRA